MAIIKASYQTRAKGTKGVMDSHRYYPYREGPDLAQRQWYDREGRALDFDQVREQMRERAQHYGCTYRITLSTAEAQLSPDDYRAVLGEQFPEYGGFCLTPQKGKIRLFPQRCAHATDFSGSICRAGCWSSVKTRA